MMMTPSRGNHISVTASPGTLGLFVNQVPGEEYLVVSGLQRKSPLQTTRLKAGDRLQGINGTDLKGWSLEKLATYCKDHTDTFKKIDILQQAPGSRLLQGFTPGKKKIVAHKKSSPLKSSRRKRIPPPISAFQKLRPPPPIGYERYILKVAPGTVGIKVKMVDGFLTIYVVFETSPIKDKVNVDDIIEGVDDVYDDQKLDVQMFVDYAKKNIGKTRFLHLFRKKKARLNPWILPIPTPQKQAPPKILNNIKSSPSLLYTVNPIVSTSPGPVDCTPRKQAPPKIPNYAKQSPSVLRYTATPSSKAVLTTPGEASKYSAAQIRASPGGSVFSASTPDPAGKSKPAGRTRRDMEWDDLNGAWVSAVTRDNK